RVSRPRFATLSASRRRSSPAAPASSPCCRTATSSSRSTKSSASRRKPRSSTGCALGEPDVQARIAVGQQEEVRLRLRVVAEGERLQVAHPLGHPPECETHEPREDREQLGEVVEDVPEKTGGDP